MTQKEGSRVVVCAWHYGTGDAFRGYLIPSFGMIPENGARRHYFGEKWRKSWFASIIFTGAQYIRNSRLVA